MKTIYFGFRFSALLFICNFYLNADNGAIRFKENKGQISDQFHLARADVKFVAGTPGLTFHFKKSGYAFQLFQTHREPDVKPEAIRSGKPHFSNESFTFYRLDINWINSNPQPVFETGNEMSGYDNYYLAVCPNGATRVKSYATLTYKNLYPDIDLKWYEKNGSMEYDYIVKPGADYHDILWEIKGAQSIKINSKGQLEISTPLGLLIEEAPLVKQQGKILNARWKIAGEKISFEITGANNTSELIIDPLVRLWGTYYGGSALDEFRYNTVDGNNNLYFTARTLSPTSLNIATVGSHQTTYGGGTFSGFSGDAILVKMNPSGVRLWSTYYGGSNNEYASVCVADNNFNIYMVGGSTSTNVGVIATSGAYQTTVVGAVGPSIGDGYIAKFDASGIRLWGTYYGENADDWVEGACLDKNGDLIVCGATMSGVNTGTLLASPGCHQAQHGPGSFNADVFVAKFSPAGARIWSTFLGEAGNDIGTYVAADSLNNIYVTGITQSTAAIATANMFQTTLSTNNNSDAFLVKFDAAGTRIWGTYYGGNLAEGGNSCHVDPYNCVVLFGSTYSSMGNSLSTPGAHQTSFGGGNCDGYIARFTPSGARRWGTYYGGNGFDEFGSGSVSKINGALYIAGRSSVGSTTAVVTCGAYQLTHGGGGNDCILAKFDSTGVRQWGTYFGGSADEPYWATVVVDGNNHLYLGGTVVSANSASVLTTSAGHQTSYGGGTNDIFIQKFDACQTIAPTPLSVYACIGQPAVIQMNQNCGLKWYSNSGLTTLVYAGGSFTTNALFNDTTFYVVESSCGPTSPAAIVQLTANISPTVTIYTSALPVCKGEQVQLFAAGADSYTWTGIAGQFSVVVTPSATTVYSVTGALLNGCRSNATVSVIANECVGMIQKDADIKFRFYPNPTCNYATLKTTEGSIFSMFDVRGSLVMPEIICSTHESIDFSTLPAGIYFGKITSDETQTSFKIVVTRE